MLLSAWSDIFLVQYKIDLNPCRSNSCQNHATCVNNGIDAYICHCVTGYTGSDCETGLIFSKLKKGYIWRWNIILYSKLRRLLHHNLTIKCSCKWMSLNLIDKILVFNILDMNECISNPCLNAATCNDLVNGYSCSCATGWTGITCDSGIYILLLRSYSPSIKTII